VSYRGSSPEGPPKSVSTMLDLFITDLVIVAYLVLLLLVVSMNFVVFYGLLRLLVWMGVFPRSWLGKS
jgi:hypothetical protein